MTDQHVPSEHGAVRLDEFSSGGAAASTSSLLRISVDEQTFPAAVERSRRTPVIFALTAGEPTSFAHVEALTGLVDGYRGRLLLALVDASAHPQIAQAFRVQVLPTTIAVIAGQPVPLFEGDVSEAQIAPVLDQVLQVAAQQGVNEVIPVDEANAADYAEPALTPQQQEAEDALTAGDAERAEQLYQAILNDSPRDEIAGQGLLQAQLLRRLGEGSHGDTPLEQALDSADRHWAAGEVQQAFDTLLAPALWSDDDARAALQKRLIDLFDLAGPTEPIVIDARRRLANLLF